MNTDTKSPAAKQPVFASKPNPKDQVASSTKKRVVAEMVSQDDVRPDIGDEKVILTAKRRLVNKDQESSLD